jgi:hypothetical protein
MTSESSTSVLCWKPLAKAQCFRNFCHARANNDAGRMGVAGGNLLQRALPRGGSGGADFLIGDGATIA